MKFYLFAKFFQHLSADELMEQCANLGFDGPTALIRDGYWLTDQSIADGLPDFIRSASTRGLEVRYADTSADAFSDDADRVFGILADNGIENVRLGYFGKTAAGDPRNLRAYAKRYAAAAEALGKRHGIRAVIQIHGHLYPHNATAAFDAVEGLDPRFIGVKLDPGNNFAQEGYEVFDYQIGILREYIAAVGAKNAGIFRGADGIWRRSFVPAYEGIADFPAIYRTLHGVGFDGPSVLMPFYDENDYPSMITKLRRELAYLREAAGAADLGGNK